MEKINHLQTLHKHIEHNLLDEYTFAQSLHYFEKYQPKFLWISLVNADNEAHMNHLKKYHETLSSYDNYLDQLFTKLKEMNLDKETMVIITTDHGRGNNAKWVTHGPEYPESRQTWAMVMNGKLQPVRTEKDVDYYNTLSIRPAIEKALL
jgi:phosphopentomutase